MIKIARLVNFNHRTLSEVNRLLAQIGLTKMPPRPLTRQSFKDLLSQKGVYFLVAQGGRGPNKKLVGMLILYFVRITSGLQAVLEDLVVDDPYRKWGVGRLLVERAIELARRKKTRHISLRTNPVRREANKLYQQMGFFKMKTNFYRINLFQ